MLPQDGQTNPVEGEGWTIARRKKGKEVVSNEAAPSAVPIVETIVPDRPSTSGACKENMLVVDPLPPNG